MNGAGDGSQWRPLLDRVVALLDELGATGWIVGGSLRDALLAQPVHDIDLAITADPLMLACRLALHGKGSVAQLRRATIRVTLNEFPDAHLDLTRLHGANIEDDLVQRDFRINALALPLAAREQFLEWLEQTGEPGQHSLPDLVDPYAGLDNLRARRLDVVSATALQDDPGRILRGARLAATLKLTATDATVAHARLAAAQLAELPDDRIREELNLLFALPHAASGFALLREMGAVRALFFSPEAEKSKLAETREDHLVGSLAALGYLHAADDSGDFGADPAYARLPLDQLRAWYAAVDPGESLARIVALGWATALHAATAHAPQPAGIAVGGDEAQAHQSTTRFVRGLPRRASSVLHAWREAQALIAPIRPDEAATRLFFDRFGPHGEAAIDALLVALACQQAQVGSSEEAKDELVRLADNVGRILTVYFEDRTQLIPPSLLDGVQVIQQLGLSQGPLVGHILRAVRVEQLSGNIATVEDALAYARKIAADAR